MPRPTPVKRLVKDAPLTAAEGDANLDQSLDYTETIENLLLEEHNTDGSHKYPAAARGQASGTTGTPQTYNATIPGTYSSLSDLLGVLVIVRIDAALTGATPLLKINGSASLQATIRKAGDQALTPGDLRPGQEAMFLCDGVYFQLLNPCNNLRVNYGEDNGTTNSIVVNVANPPASIFEVPAAYYAGYRVLVKVNNTNTGACTFNVASGGVTLTAKDVQKGGKALTGGELVDGGIYELVYDGTQFQVLGRPTEVLIDSGTNLLLTAAGQSVSMAHGLGRKPRFVRVVIKNIGSTDQEWAADDEIEVCHLRTSAGVPITTVGSDATNVTFIKTATASVQVNSKTSVTMATLTQNWRIMAYAGL